MDPRLLLLCDKLRSAQRIHCEMRRCVRGFAAANCNSTSIKQRRSLVVTVGTQSRFGRARFKCWRVTEVNKVAGRCTNRTAEVWTRRHPTAGTGTVTDGLFVWRYFVSYRRQVAPNNAEECVALLLSIRAVPGLNIDPKTCYPLSDLSWSSSVILRKCSDRVTAASFQIL
jgi:hypothetical protein